MGLLCFHLSSAQRHWQLLFCTILSRMLVEPGRIEIVSYFSRADLFPAKDKNFISFWGNVWAGWLLVLL